MTQPHPKPKAERPSEFATLIEALRAIGLTGIPNDWSPQTESGLRILEACARTVAAIKARGGKPGKPGSADDIEDAEAERRAQEQLKRSGYGAKKKRRKGEPSDNPLPWTEAAEEVSQPVQF